MSTQAQKLPSEAVNWIVQWLSEQKITAEPVFHFQSGDGSTRHFVRIQLPHLSYLLLWDPAWNMSKDYPELQSYLSSLKLSVPAFYAVNPQLGCLIMEDLGNELLQARIQSEPQQKLLWLKKACFLLAELHGRSFPVPQKLAASQRCFDAPKYEQELRFTLEHLVYGFLNLSPISEQQEKDLLAFCREIASLSPQVFCHRDFHCRNLMVHKDKLVMIDFQDSRLGPAQYDLASLVYDAYVPLKEDERKTLIEDYRENLTPYPMAGQIPWDVFQEELEAVAFQRIVKAAGSFASFFTRYGKTSHLPYLLPALESAAVLGQNATGLLAKYQNLFDINTWVEKTTAQLKMMGE